MPEQQAYKLLYNQVRGAHRRLNFILFCQQLSKSVFYSLIAITVFLIAMKFTPWSVPVGPVFAAGLLLSLPVTGYLFWRGNKSLKEAAILVDDHLRLKEKISTALELAKQHEDGIHAEWTKAQLSDALNEVKRMKLSAAFPWQAPFEARWLWAPALALLLVGYVIPQLQLYTGGMTIAQADELDKKAVEKEVQALIKRQLKLERREKSQQVETAAKMKKDIQELADKLSKGKMEKRDALSEISKVEKKWEEQREQMMAMQQQQTRAMPLSQMKMTSELAQSIQAGNFAKAAKKLEELQKKLKMDGLSEEAKERLAQEMKSLAQSLDADMPMGSALEQASLELNGDDLAAAMESLQMAEMSMKDLADMMKQMAMLEESLKELGECKLGLLGKCKACGSGNCKGGMCQGSGTGPWRAGDSNKQNNGMGGPGIGQGGKAPFEETETAFNQAKLNSEFHNAPISGLLNVKGEPQAEGSTLMPQGTSIAMEQEREDAMVKERVPIPYRNKVRLYFDSLHGTE